MSISIGARAAGPRAKFGLLLLGSLAGIMAAGGASAARLDSDVPSVVVKYNEQSLATDEGVYALYRRITTAEQLRPTVSPRTLASVRRRNSSGSSSSAPSPRTWNRAARHRA